MCRPSLQAIRILLVGTLLAGLEWACAREPLDYDRVSVEGLDEARSFLDAGELEKAEALAREILARVQDEQGSRSLEASLVLDLLVDACIQGRGTSEPECLEMAERAVKIKGDLLPPDHIGHVMSLANLAIVRRDQGEAAEAKQLLQRALEIARRPPHEPDMSVVLVLNDLANIHLGLGEYVEAEPLYLEAVDITRAIKGENDPEVALSLYNLGRLYRHMGDLDAAHPRYEAALRILKKDHPWYSLGLNGFAILLEDEGDYAGAREAYQEAYAIAREVDPNGLSVIHCLNNLGLNHLKTGDYRKARSLYQEALDMMADPETPDAASTLMNLGEVAHLEKKLDEAGSFYKKALDICQDNPRSPLTGEILDKLGNLSLDTGNPRKAEHYFEEARTIWEAHMGKKSTHYAISLSGMARAAEQSGDLETSEKLFRQALAIREEILDPAHPDVAAGLLNVGRLLTKTENTDQAIEPLLRAETISRDHLRLTAQVLAEREVLYYGATRTSGLDLALSLAESPPDSASVGPIWDAMIRSRSEVLDEMAARHRVFHHDDPEIHGLAVEFESASRRLANLLVRGSDGDPRLNRSLIADARDTRDAAERALARRSGLFRQEERMRLTGFAEVSEGLPPRSALVAFARFDLEGLPPVKEKQETRYLAFVLRAPGADPAVVPLGDARRVDEAINRWTSLMQPAAGRHGPAYRDAGEDLRRLVWDPLEPLLGRAERIFVIPDGEIHRVNLDSLPVGDTGFLIESSPPIHYLSAERDLVAAGDPSPRGRGLLAIGGVDFDRAAVRAAAGSFRGARSGCIDLRSQPFHPLPGSAAEAREVAALWNAATRNGPDAAVVLLQAREATEAAFKETAPGMRVLHLSTHGFFCDGSGRGGSTSQRGLEMRPLPLEGNPLLLSGLALAGANDRGAASLDEEDGILTAEEIAAMDLSGVDWAVLSACDTGLGEVRSGEGVFGLRRALGIAGVRTLVMSLWPVEDLVARDWMKAFYRWRLIEGRDVTGAVREASLELLARSRANGPDDNPTRWAPFVAVGHWN